MSVLRKLIQASMRLSVDLGSYGSYFDDLYQEWAIDPLVEALERDLPEAEEERLRKLLDDHLDAKKRGGMEKTFLSVINKVTRQFGFTNDVSEEIAQTVLSDTILPNLEKFKVKLDARKQDSNGLMAYWKAVLSNGAKTYAKKIRRRIVDNPVESQDQLNIDENKGYRPPQTNKDEAQKDLLQKEFQQLYRDLLKHVRGYKKTLSTFNVDPSDVDTVKMDKKGIKYETDPKHRGKLKVTIPMGIMFVDMIEEYKKEVGESFYGKKVPWDRVNKNFLAKYSHLYPTSVSTLNKRASILEKMVFDFLKDRMRNSSVVATEVIDRVVVSHCMREIIAGIISRVESEISDYVSPKQMVRDLYIRRFRK